MNIAIAGPGLMGSQIGAEYALGGHHVAFVARNIDRGIDRLNAAFDIAASLELWTPDQITEAHNRVVFVPVVSDLNPDTELFLESIIEDAAVKIEILKSAAARMPGAILASNTSSLSIGRLGGWAGASKRTIGTHYWNPPLLMPLVEVVAGPETEPAIIPRVMDVLRDLGKRPVAVDRDVDGFVWNRLQLALLREAVWIVEQKVASPEVVDEIVRDGLARRWRYTGPFATAALGGPQTFTKVANNLWPELSHAAELHDLARWLIDNPEKLASIKANRDAGLIEDLKKDREGH
ncbi:3-hydroxyacyl-CoA dehydrogenase family protein [soil metagenome]